MVNKASIPNPALKPLSVLVGKWETAGSHPYFPGVELHGEAGFEWIEGGAFLKITSKVDHPKFPDGISIIGSDDSSNEMFMIYFDERGVSRKYDCCIEGNQWKWWRNDPNFSQRFTVTIATDGETMSSKGEMRKENGDWEGDLSLTYRRIK